ncbi:four helix bundle protein [Thalassoroseus pseudoceratinae]|uniref:four helix bundle protein n=1 Tax=Thalassoroseus pseudoceratinae TaxID=2713176 RepID=UPI001421613A|nr:four helix bundle protein [Thalassoroseus pseudoceratinae]
MAFQSFEDLEVWKKACTLAVFVYETLQESRDFGLKDQMQRAAVSIASNNAEGTERTNKDFARFLTIARGSSAELRTQAYIAGKIKIIPTEAMKHIVEETKQINRMSYALTKSLQNKPN